MSPRGEGKKEEFHSVRDRPALQTWLAFIQYHLENWNKDEATADVSGVATPISPVAAWRPLKNLDAPAEDMPPGWVSLGHDHELFAEHLQTQAALHTDEINKAIIEWSRTWRRPRLAGEADFYFSLRLSLARDLIQGLFAGYPLPPHLTQNRPDLTDYPQSLKWLLVRLWDGLGSHYLQMVADRERARMRFKIEPSR